VGFSFLFSSFLVFLQLNKVYLCCQCFVMAHVVRCNAEKVRDNCFEHLHMFKIQSHVAFLVCISRFFCHGINETPQTCNKFSSSLFEHQIKMLNKQIGLEQINRPLNLSSLFLWILIRRLDQFALFHTPSTNLD
jgi:hypothetical protein